MFFFWTLKIFNKKHAVLSNHMGALKLPTHKRSKQILQMIKNMIIKAVYGI